jgi:hypothetical protein
LSSDERKSIDSTQYAKDHQDAKSVINEVNSFTEKIMQSGYIEAAIEKNEKANDSTFNYQFRLGKRISTLYIYVSQNCIYKNLIAKEGENDTLKIPINAVENFLQQTLSKLEKKGFALSL